MTEELTRAAGKPASSSAKKKTSSTSTARKKTSTAKKKTGTTTAKKKTSTSNTIRLTAAEKKLITNYRKCGTLQKQIISLVIEKVAGGVTKLDGIERMINMDENQ
jgi:hypothetical protein